MIRRSILGLLLVVTALSQFCCNSLGTLTELSDDEARKLRIAREKLVVLPLLTPSPRSGFPVSPRVVITAAHCISPRSPFASAGGVPVASVSFDKDYTRGFRKTDDWVGLHCTTDQFSGNRFDPTVALQRDDIVFLGGYHGEKEPLDPLCFISRAPSIIAGRVLEPSSSAINARTMVRIAVPTADYLGMSGGPVAIVDGNGVVRAFGLVTLGGLDWDQQDFCFRYVLVALRLTQRDIDRIKGVQLMPVGFRDDKPGS